MFDFFKKIKDKVLDKKDEKDSPQPQPEEVKIPVETEEHLESDEIQDEPVLDENNNLTDIEVQEEQTQSPIEDEQEEDSIFIKPDNVPWIDNTPISEMSEVPAEIFIEPDDKPWTEVPKLEEQVPLETDVFIEPDDKPWVDLNPKENEKEVKTDIFIDPDDKPWVEIPKLEEQVPVQTDIFIEPEESVSSYQQQDIEQLKSIEEENFDDFSDTIKETELSNITQEKTSKENKGWFGLKLNVLKEKISKTTETLITNVVSFASSKEKLDDETIDEIEEKLIKADLGLDVSIQIATKLRENQGNIKPNQLKEYLKTEFSKILLISETTNNLKYTPGQLNIYLVTGVNGVGKTTLIGKLAYRFKENGQKVLIAAGDTFRAAAEEQLNIWSNRAGADIVRKDGADPSSVIFDAITKAKKENYDVLLIDTAGRLHNKFNLMEELRKIRKTIDRNGEDLLTESILVLDATTGQNGLQQAKVFSEAVQLTGVALTKLDGSAKGGIIIAIASEMNLPVKLVGVGEKIQDLKDFDPNMFLDALFS